MAYQIFQLPKAQPLTSAGRVLPGNKVSFYLTTTITPTPVYTTSALNVAHTQPVEADAGGRLPPIFLDPTIIYKATVTDSAGVLLYTVDPVNDQLLSQGVIGAYLYPTTSAETSAGVTPVNKVYPPGDVRRYGAVLDGTTDDHQALGFAIAQAAQANGGQVFIPAGTFTIAADSSALLDNVHIRGAGRGITILKPRADSGDNINSIFTASDVNNWSLRDLSFNGNVPNLSQSSAHCAVYISGCSNWVIDNCDFTDFGRDESPLGAHVLVSCLEVGDANGPSDEFDVQGEPSIGWRISNCHFYDLSHICEFGVRLWSDFLAATADDDFTVFIRDGIIENCYFEGFMWNPIELAGPGVRFNTVSNCVSRDGEVYGGFEADKGARWNTFLNCGVEDVDMVKTDQCAFRCQGYEAGGVNPTRYALGNKFIGCYVNRMGGDSTIFPIGIWVKIAKQTTIIDFDAYHMTDGGGNKFAPVVRVDDAYDTVVIGGTWENVVGGVYIGPCNEVGVVDGLSVIGVNSETTYRFYLTSGSATCTRLKFANNTIELNNQIGFNVSGNEEITISDNHLLSAGGGSGNTGVSITSSTGRTHVVGNNFNDFNIGVDYSGGSAINVVVRGNTFHSCAGNISGSNAVRNSQAENYATDAGGVARTQTFGTAAPGAGTWFVGDVVWHSAPAASGNIGWVCTTGGSPGTWKTFGAIAA